MRYPAGMFHTPLPLPTVWTADLSWFFMALFRPIVSAGRVVARCGARVVSCRAEDGAIEWSAEVDAEGGNGAFFLAHEGMYLTEQARTPPDCLGTILALDAGGHERWRTDLDTMVALGSAVVHQGALCALSLDHEGRAPTLLHRMALADGALRDPVPMRWPADAVLPWGEGLLARNQRAGAAAPGLYRMGLDGQDPTPILTEPVLELAREGDLLLAVTRAGSEHTVRVYGATSLTPLWSAPVATEAAALDRGELFHVEQGEGGHCVVVARDARAGTVRWRSPLLPPRIASIAAGGPVLICNHRKGQAVCRRADGSLLGEVRGSYGPPVHAGDRLYVCRPGAILCASVEALAV